ncbi:MAG: hypothetical protein LBP82_01100 [Candidatus Methanoplasma sp.]|nr:hypothetical protein [Candidatus Methanoplasma sp.]
MKKTKGIDYVKITSRLFLDKFEEINGFLASGVLFNKYMTLLHRRLKNEGIDIRLPHCWYRWGDEVVRYRMPYLDWDHEYAAYTQVSWDGTMREIYDPNDRVIKMASEYTDEFISKYSGAEGAEMAIDEVYDEAPFEFQNRYRQLRETLKQLRTNNAMYFDGASINMIVPLFEGAIRSFPKEFKSIANEKEDFVEMFRVMIESRAMMKDLFNITEDFWFFFCYHLRVKCNENVPSSTLNVWKDKIPEETELFEQKLQSYAHRFYDGSDRSLRAKKLFEGWEENDREFRELIDKLPDNEEDVLSFVREIRSGSE